MLYNVLYNTICDITCYILGICGLTVCDVTTICYVTVCDIPSYAMLQGCYIMCYVCWSHLLGQYFGARTSLLHRSLLRPCHLVWPGWITPGCCGPVGRLVTVTWWHAALQLQPSSYNFKLMIGKLEVGDWPLSPRGQGWALYVSMGCMQNFWRPRG